MKSLESLKWAHENLKKRNGNVVELSLRVCLAVPSYNDYTFYFIYIGYDKVTTVNYKLKNNYVCVCML